MTKMRWFPGIAAAVGMLILILDGKTALSGAYQGMELCIRRVIPSLFPFFVLSGVIVSTFWGCQMPVKIPILPRGAESLLVTGFLGGYPVGAQSVAQAYRNGQLSKSQAERMLLFCSNAGPSFLFGILGSLFPSIGYCWALWGIHIASALLAARILPSETCRVSLRSGKPVTLSEALSQAVKIMASVCGWIILFRIVISFLERWFLWMLDRRWQVFITGLLELSNGCVALSDIQDCPQRFLMCSVLLALGGVCVTMQTVSVTQGLSLRYYFPGKGLQAVFSALLCWLVLPKQTLSPWIPALAVVMGLVFVGILRKMQNNSSIPRLIGV